MYMVTPNQTLFHILSVKHIYSPFPHKYWGHTQRVKITNEQVFSFTYRSSTRQHFRPSSEMIPVATMRRPDYFPFNEGLFKYTWRPFIIFPVFCSFWKPHYYVYGHSWSPWLTKLRAFSSACFILLPPELIHHFQSSW